MKTAALRRSTHKSPTHTDLVVGDADIETALGKFLLVVSKKDGVTLVNNRGIRLVVIDPPDVLSAEDLRGIQHAIVLKSPHMPGPTRQLVQAQLEQAHVRSIRMAYEYEDFADFVSQIMRGSAGVTVTFAPHITLRTIRPQAGSSGFTILAPRDISSRGRADTYSKAVDRTMLKLLEQIVDLDDYTLPSVVIAAKYFPQVVKVYTATTILTVAKVVRLLTKVNIPRGVRNQSLYELVRFYMHKTHNKSEPPAQVARAILSRIRQSGYPDLPTADKKLLDLITPVIIRVQQDLGL